MFQQVDGALVVSVNDWCKAGLTYNQFRLDSQRDFLNIFRRGINGNTLIDVRSIKRQDRLDALEAAYGKIQKAETNSVFYVERDQGAVEFFTSFLKEDGSKLEDDQILKYINRASIFEGVKRGLEVQRAARARSGKRLLMGKFWKQACQWYGDQLNEFPADEIKNARSFERAFKAYIKEGYQSILHKNLGNDSARLVSARMENLFLAIYRIYHKPFVTDVHRIYMEFVSGTKELFDKETGEIFKPEDFRYKGRAIEVSEATIWNYLKNVLNNTSIYDDRNGNFDYVNKRRPKHKRKVGQYSLSKITMDDVAISRKSDKEWVYKYIAVDVVSGYIFRPPYIVGKPTIDTVIECFRYMFCELIELGLPMPGELEVENHLMRDIPWLNELFPFVRFCSSATEKRAEHTNRQFKYGVSKRNGHTRGRWYASNEAYRSVRYKVDGDMVEPVYPVGSIISDDLNDIEEYNNELHPLQKTYPGMTRKEVLLQQYNPNLKPIDQAYLYKFIGNETSTSIYNNDYCPLQYEQFTLKNFEDLKRLKPNNYKVTAFWLPEEDGSIKNAYLYQDGKYIGEVINSTQYKYNENKIEQTEEDRANMLYQDKRNAKFDKLIRDRKKEIYKVGWMDAQDAQLLDDVEVEVLEGVQPKGYEEDEFTRIENVNFGAQAIGDM